MPLAPIRSSARSTTLDRRPIAFLVSTTPCARSIRDHLGSPAYSYYFVAQALAPVLERLGTWRLIDHPESRLSFAARTAEAQGFRPIHLAINPLQDVYLSPAMPNVVFPFWEFPDVPNRDFGLDSRQNWVRACKGASLVLTACEFSARAFRRAGVEIPVAVVPIPLGPEAFRLPPWDLAHSWTLDCRHEVLGPEPSPITKPTILPPSTAADPPRTLRGRAWQTARRGFRRIEPWIDPELVGRLTRTRRALADVRFSLPGLRDGYRRYVRRWLSQDALERVSSAKLKALGGSSAASRVSSPTRPCRRARSRSKVWSISRSSTSATSARITGTCSPRF